jgi:hypothetical protein
VAALKTTNLPLLNNPLKRLQKNPFHDMMSVFQVGIVNNLFTYGNLLSHHLCPLTQKDIMSKRKHAEAFPNLTSNNGITFKKLPKSCIESACHVIQSFTANKVEPWKNGDTTESGEKVWAVFDNKMICINRRNDVVADLTGVKTAKFDSTKLKAGRGLMLGNSTKSDKKYNMHLGAFLGMSDDNFVLSDLAEDGKITNVAVTRDNTIFSKSSTLLQDFRGEDYKNSQAFKLAFLYADSDPDLGEIKKGFSKDQILDEEPTL